MFIQRVEIENFGPFEKASYAVPDRGLVLIEGENRDGADAGSNGAGKSMLVADALSWCLYGKTLRGVSHDEVVRAGSSGGTRVRVLLTAFGHQLEVTRHRQHSVGKNTCTIVQDGKNITPAVRPDEVLGPLLGVPWEVWKYALCLGQGLAYRFTALTDTERVTLLEELLGLDVYDSARAYSLRKMKEQAAKHSMASIHAEQAELREAQGRGALAAAEKTLAALSAQAKPVAGPSRKELARKLADAEIRWQSVAKDMREAVDAYTSKQRELDSSQQMVRRAHERIELFRKRAQQERDTAATLAAGSCDRCGQAVGVEAVKVLVAKHQAMADAAQQEATKELALSAQHEIRAAEAGAEVKKLVEQRERLCAVEEDWEKHVRQLRAALAATPEPVSADVLAAAEAAVEAARATVVDAGQARSDAVAEAAEAARKKHLWDFWVSGFARLRQQAIRKAVTVLSARFAHYVEALFGSAVQAGIELVDKSVSSGHGVGVTLSVATPGGSYESASGGERDRIDLALALALHDLVTHASGAKCNVLVADEIGGFIDEGGVGRVVQLLREKADSIGTVFVMTQNPVWRRHIEDSWKVVKESGTSTLIQYRG